MGATLRNVYVASQEQLDTDLLTWQLIETVEISSAAGGQTSAFTAHDELMILYNVVKHTAGHVRIQFNLDTGNNYSSGQIEMDGDVAERAGQAGIILGVDIADHTQLTGMMVGNGKIRTDSAGHGFAMMSAATATNEAVSHTAFYTSATDITLVRVAADADTIDGYFSVYGRNW